MRETDKTVGFYPGSFNPWHKGHDDVLAKALKVFDTVIVGLGVNPDKHLELPENVSNLALGLEHMYGDRVQLYRYSGLLVDAIKDIEDASRQKISGVIRGLRNGNDLQYEMNQQYWNEDLGLTIPTVYFITDRSLAHISSSAIRAVRKFKNAKNTPIT